ncbi:HlyD family efflux transporter periplasmic adaptor subunit [Sphingomonas sp. RB56-2]|uniref:HlyD family efflux transporter periplasmic adaptor subunit n=1 Tax=Sphingomonas brevis TaxID=2908206 RepID=A0ABT0S6D7_9SPHN|nr:HlyD family efflux transporter periplasmic adaptor subunit [Sphingomonas brevis]MCL6739745.1 HlyD family efflux transporter periplasmic adaptor subunit [Sphingomonas brevis]
MTRGVRILILLVAIVAVAYLAWRWFGPGPRERYLSGYVEGESLFLAAPVAGTVGSIMAEEGQRIAGGARLFAIDPATLSAQGEQAQAQVTEARTQIASAQANAQQAEAEVAAAAADADKARRDLNRLLGVRRDDAAAVAGTEIDTAEAALREASARLRAAQQTAEARRAQVAAARAQENQAKGGSREVDIRVGQLSPPSPSPARVEEIFFRPGEWVAANQPVVSILPDDRIKVRFFVPEQDVARYRPGQSVRFSCDSCAPGLTAKISYVSPRSEFTPPIIFSRDSRDRLVFMVEALPAKPAGLMPGLPVDVEPLP